MDNSRAEQFVSCLHPDLGATADKLDIVQLLDKILERVTHKWPNFKVDEQAFIAYLAERIGNGPVSTALQSIKVEELYLACACAKGDELAIEQFIQLYVPDFSAVLHSMKIEPTIIDDVQQLVTEKLIVGASGGRIRDYAGLGSLRTWTRVIAVRMALTQLRKKKREVPLEDETLLLLRAPDDNAEAIYLKKKYRREFKEAFHQALEGLTPRDRNLLRMHLVEGLTIDQVGKIYSVHRATAFRWIAKARDKVWDDTKTILSSKLQIDSQGYQSLVELVRSQLDLSIERALSETDQKQ